MLDNPYDLNYADDVLPMMVKYAYDNVNGDTGITFFPMDKIKENWKKWKEDDNISALKWSNRYCANSISVKQRALKFIADEALNAQQLNLLAHMEHNRWVIEKLLMGYRRHYS